MAVVSNTGVSRSLWREEDPGWRLPYSFSPFVSVLEWPSPVGGFVGPYGMGLLVCNSSMG